MSSAEAAQGEAPPVQARAGNQPCQKRHPGQELLSRSKRSRNSTLARYEQKEGVGTGCCGCCGCCGFHFRLTGSLVSGEGALKRFKLAAPTRRMRVCPWVDPQPMTSPCPSWSVGPRPLLAVWDCAAFFRQSSPALNCQTQFLMDEMIAVFASGSHERRKTKHNRRDVSDHGSRKDLHHFPRFSTIQGRQKQTRGVTTWITGQEKQICAMSTISSHNQRTGWENTKLFVSLSARVKREQSTKTVRMEQYIKTHRHSNTQARATLGSRPSNHATQALDLGQVTVHRQQLISATQPCGSGSLKPRDLEQATVRIRHLISAKQPCDSVT